MTAEDGSGKVRRFPRIHRPWEVALLLLLLAMTLWYSFKAERDTGVVETARKGTGTCVHVVDGDTLAVRPDGKEESIIINLVGVHVMEMYDDEVVAEQAERYGRSAEHIRRIGEKAFEATRDMVLNLRVEWQIPEEIPVAREQDLIHAYVLVRGDDLAEYLLLLGLAVPDGTAHPKAERYRELAKPLMQ